MKRLITTETVEQSHAAGVMTIAAPFAQAIVTPAAWTTAAALGVVILLDAKATAAVDKGSSERVVDPSGVIVVRGGSVRMGSFTDGGTHVGLTEVVSGADRSPMSAGFMSWSRDDSFAWSLDYDEVDLVLEGTLEIRIDGRVVSGSAGDVFYIPKSSRIVFGTPDRVRLFYVTYPAEWKKA